MVEKFVKLLYNTMIDNEINTKEKMQKYKKIEKRFASNVHNGFVSFFKAVKNFFVRIFKVFDSELTIMIVPHSQKKVLNIQTNVFALVLGFTLVVGVITSFLYFNRRAVSANIEINTLMAQNRDTLASLDELRDENANLFQAAKRFQSSLSQSLSLLGLSQVENQSNSSIKSLSGYLFKSLLNSIIRSSLLGIILIDLTP